MVIRIVTESLILLSTDPTLAPEQIIQLCAQRFPLELAIRDLKQHLGSGDYRCLSFLALSRFMGLALISFCLWRLVLLHDVDADWLQSHDQTSPLSFTTLSRAVRRPLPEQIFSLPLLARLPKFHSGPPAVVSADCLTGLSQAAYSSGPSQLWLAERLKKVLIHIATQQVRRMVSTDKMGEIHISSRFHLTLTLSHSELASQ